jgi:8-oxo-dGTP diphosphatase
VTAETKRIRCAGAILYNAHGQILIQQRDAKPGLLFPLHWTTLGGRVEDGEHPDDAIRRELLEEIELEPQVRFWRIFEHAYEVDGEQITVEQHVYVGEINLPVSDIVLNEGQALGYFEADDINNLPIAFGLAPLFKDFFKARP